MVVKKELWWTCRQERSARWAAAIRMIGAALGWAAEETQDQSGL
jgi:hypothetical protein